MGRSKFEQGSKNWQDGGCKAGGSKFGCWNSAEEGRGISPGHGYTKRKRSFCSKDIPGRTVLEVSPVLVLDPVENEEHIRKTNLYNYTYNWPYTPPSEANAQGNTNSAKSPTTTQAVILGLGSMFNHSTLHQNVGWDRDVKNLLVTYITLRDIKAGEELCISYGQRLTFEDKDEEEPEVGSEDWTD